MVKEMGIKMDLLRTKWMKKHLELFGYHLDKLQLRNESAYKDEWREAEELLDKLYEIIDGWSLDLEGELNLKF